MNAAIAKHLNVIENAILEVREWAHVLWVRVRGVGCRFVSKKVVAKVKSKKRVVQIFQLNGINSTPDWHVDGPDSLSFYIGTHVSAPGRLELIRDAKRVLAYKGLDNWASNAEFEIRPEDLTKIAGASTNF